MKMNDWLNTLSLDKLNTESIADSLEHTPVDVDALVQNAENGNALYPFYTFARSSVTLDAREYSIPSLGSGNRIITGAGMKAAFDLGYTLKAQFLEVFYPELIGMIRPLSRRLRGRPTVYGFVTPSSTRGLSIHRDASHVLVLQVSGEKNWHVWEPESDTPVPSRAGLVENPSGVERKFTLRPGDMMFMPYGWAHAAEAGESDSSFHLTWTIDTLTPSEIGSVMREAGDGESGSHVHADYVRTVLGYEVASS